MALTIGPTLRLNLDGRGEPPSRLRVSPLKISLSDLWLWIERLHPWGREPAVIFLMTMLGGLGHGRRWQGFMMISEFMSDGYRGVEVDKGGREVRELKRRIDGVDYVATLGSTACRSRHSQPVAATRSRFSSYSGSYIIEVQSALKEEKNCCRI
ncbi:hypothetical protein DITRI_Ditri18aG0094300 [Diplodiscus trichospermus]